MIPSFQTNFAVPMSCSSCADDISQAVKKLDGIISVDADFAQQLVAVQGTAAPSAIVAAIQATGRDAILRGSGAPNSAAVCILETHAASVADPVRGLARLVQVAPNLTLFDVSVKGVAPGQYCASVRETGDISRGPESTGPVWEAAQAQREGGAPRGALGMVEVAQNGAGSVFFDKPIQVWELVGRSIVVSAQEASLGSEDPNTLVGVIARSAGIWDNTKTVCSCTGKTLWEERREQVDRGML